MKKNNILLLSLMAITSSLIYGCNGGGSSSNSPAPSYLPAGNYTMSYSNMQPAENCSVVESSIPVTVNSSGEICGMGQSSSCTPAGVNANSNPCLQFFQSQIINSTTVSVQGSWVSCAINSATNVFTATNNLSITVNNTPFSCTGTVTLTPVLQ